jgi:hypothetical protein
MNKTVKKSKPDNGNISESDILKPLIFIVKKEIIFGFLFVLIGVTLLFRKLLDINLDVAGIISAAFFAAGVWFHLKFFQNKAFFKFFLLGQIFLLLALTLSEHLVPIGIEKIFVLFILFQIAAVSALAYTIRNDIPLLIVLCLLPIVMIVIYLMSPEAPLQIQGSAAIWSIAYAFFYISFAKPAKSRIFLFLSGLFFLIGLANTSSQSESFLSVLFLWFLGFAFLVYYIQNTKLWWPLIPSFVLMMSGFDVFNSSVLRFFPKKWMAFFWTAGFAAVFLLIWILTKNKKPQKWSLWVSAMFAISGIIIMVTDIIRLEGEIAVPAILIIIGIWLIYSKTFRQSKIFKKT